MNLIRQLLYQEHAAATELTAVFRTSGIRKALKVETTTLIGYPERDAIFNFVKPYFNAFGPVFAIAVDDGVVDGFGQADKYVAVGIWAQPVFFGDFLDESLDRGNISRIRV